MVRVFRLSGLGKKKWGMEVVAQNEMEKGKYIDGRRDRQSDEKLMGGTIEFINGYEFCVKTGARDHV